MQTKILTNLTKDAELELLAACREVLKLRTIAARDHASSVRLYSEAAERERTIWAVLQRCHATERTQRYCLELMAAEYEQ